MYWCLELNAHELIHYLVNCRDKNAEKQFVVQNLTSQPCETSFRELRSMTTINHTAVNFTMKDLEQRMQKLQMKLLIAHRRKNILCFPSLRKQASKTCPFFDLPNDDEIAESILAAEKNATELLISVGFDKDKIKFSHSFIIRNSNIPLDLEYVNVDEESSDGSSDGK